VKSRCTLLSMVLAKALKVEIEITVDALKAYDAGDYDTALQKFEVSLLSLVY